MFKLGFVFVAVALFVCSSYAADLLTEDVDSLMEYSNRNFKDRGNDSEINEDDGFGESEASRSKQKQGYNRFFF